jgi:hypothetical protein
MSWRTGDVVLVRRVTSTWISFPRTRCATTASTASAGFRCSPFVTPPSMNLPSRRHWSLRSPESADGQDVLAVGMRLEPTGGNPPAHVVRATASCRTIIRKMSQWSQLRGVITDLPGKLWLDDARESARVPGLMRIHSRCGAKLGPALSTGAPHCGTHYHHGDTGYRMTPRGFRSLRSLCLWPSSTGCSRVNRPAVMQRAMREKRWARR